MAERPTSDEVRARLEELAARRGFLLPHHGALASGAPELHAAYLAMYDALTVSRRELTELERESVWLALLVASEEAVGTHHLALFRETGGSDAQAEALIALAGAAAVSDALDFAVTHWQGQLPALDPEATWARSLDALRGPLPEGLADLCLLAVQAARGSRGGVARQLRRLYARQEAEPRLVEALSYVIWPRGVNAFLEACEVWHRLMVAGEVVPSPRFAAWRDMPGLGAYRAGAVAGFGKEDEDG